MSACEAASAWMSVLIATKSMNVPAPATETMRLSVLPPPPPTPITLMEHGETPGADSCGRSAISGGGAGVGTDEVADTMSG